MKQNKKIQIINMKKIPLLSIKKYALGGDYEKKNGCPALWGGIKFTKSPKNSIAGKLAVMVDGQEFVIGLSKKEMSKIVQYT